MLNAHKLARKCLAAALLAAAVPLAGGLLAARVASGETPAAAPAAPAAASSPASATPASATAAPGDDKSYVQRIPGTDATFRMVAIPGGTFKMGSPANEEGRKDDEGPQIEVEVDPFFMGSHEVTWGEYGPFLRNYERLTKQDKQQVIPAAKLADAVTYPTPLYELDAGPRLERMGRGPKSPAVIMSNFAAKQYCKWLSKKTGRFYRLPTEAEWEYACRAGTTTAYNFGDDPKKLEDHAWFFDNSPLADGDGAYREVGKKKANAFGLFDMHGNVCEWCADQYQADWFKQFAGKKVKASEIINWPTKQYPRVIRGGGWDSEAPDCRSARRIPSEPNMNKQDPQIPKSPYWLTEGFMIGFRVVSPAKEPPDDIKHKFWDVDDPQTAGTIVRDRDVREVIEAAAAEPAAGIAPTGAASTGSATGGR